jgi:hypothetical protein
MAYHDFSKYKKPVTNDKTAGEKEADKEVAKNGIARSRFGICFMLADKKGETQVQMVTYGDANLNEYALLVEQAIQSMQKIWLDTLADEQLASSKVGKYAS